jgi:hypothetical protein
VIAGVFFTYVRQHMIRRSWTFLLEKADVLGTITLATVWDPLVLTDVNVSPIGLVQFLVLR